MISKQNSYAIIMTMIVGKIIISFTATNLIISLSFEHNTLIHFLISP